MSCGIQMPVSSIKYKMVLKMKELLMGESSENISNIYKSCSDIGDERGMVHGYIDRLRKNGHVSNWLSTQLRMGLNELEEKEYYDYNT